MPDGMTAAKPRSRLKAVAPKAATPSKPKILIYGKAGVGKTWGSTSFPACYFIDAEDGANLPQYTDRLAAAGGVYMGQEQGALDMDVVVNEIKALATERHEFRTLIIDSVSKLYNTAILHEQLRLGDKDAFGASKKPAVQKIRNMLDWVRRLDMNVIFIAQEKELWDANGKAGVTFDCDPKLEYDLHLVLHIFQQGPKRMARIGKSRLAAFPSGETFEWSFEGFAERYGREILEAASTPINLATAEQIAEVKRLLEIVKVPDDFEEKCFARANVESWTEMEAEKVTALIASLKSKLSPSE